MLSKFSVVIVIGLNSFLAAANPIVVAGRSETSVEVEGQYPPGMPSVCRPYYTPPRSCPSVSPTPSQPPPSQSKTLNPSPTKPPPEKPCPTSTGMHSSSSAPGSPSTPVGSSSPPLKSPPPSTTRSTSSSTTSRGPPPTTTSSPSSPATGGPPTSTPHTTATPTSPTGGPSTPHTTTTPNLPRTTSSTVPTTTVTVTHTPTATSISQCNTGKVQCCNQVQKASDASVTHTLGLLGVVLEDPDVLVGMGCSPLSVLGVDSGANCAQQPVCCENNQFNGLINIGCTPISL